MLDILNVEKSFGGYRALNGCSLTVPKGSVTGIIGPNGAGKSTLFNIIGGVLSPCAGSVRLEGTSLDDFPIHHRAQAGLVRTFQISRELSQLTVLENMLLAGQTVRSDSILRAIFQPGSVREEERCKIAKAREILESVDLWRLANEPAASLSGGQKKLLEISRALMLDPKVILLDEPTAGVSPALCDVLTSTISRLRGCGVTFAIIEHDMEMVEKICDPVFVLAEGRTLTSGSFQEVSQNQEVMRAYLGRSS